MKPLAIDPIVALDAQALSQAIHARQVSCREVMQAYLAHIDQVNPKLNAIVARRDSEELLREAGYGQAQPSALRASGALDANP